MELKHIIFESKHILSDLKHIIFDLKHIGFGLKHVASAQMSQNRPLPDPKKAKTQLTNNKTRHLLGRRFDLGFVLEALCFDF